MILRKITSSLQPHRPDWTRRMAAVALLLAVGATLPLSTGCSDARARQEDARILAEFRGPFFIAVADRRPNPVGPPLVPHVVYAAGFQCLTCHGNEQFHFRGQAVPHCRHPERSGCLQCHVALQTREQPFEFEMLGKGDLALQTSKPKPPTP